MKRSSMLAMTMAALTLMACQNPATAVEGKPYSGAHDAPPSVSDSAFKREVLATFDEPWAMAFLPDGRLLITEKAGRLRVFNANTGQSGTVTGLPEVAYGGQGGLGDIALHPEFAKNGIVYLSFAESGEKNTRGAAVMRAHLGLDNAGNGALDKTEIIWRQSPKVAGEGHYSHRLLFSPDGKLFITSGERQKFTPAQDMKTNLGKILRLNDDGTVPADNPFVVQGGVAAQVCSLGHRNVLGIAFHPVDGKLYENEMGPRGGDEFNRIERAENYGYPIVSDGDHYDGRDIPDHATRPEFHAPMLTWTPVISPSSLMFYTGALFPQWKNDALIGGLSSQALIRVRVENDKAREVERYPMVARIRAVIQAPDGSVWVMEDGKNAKLLRLTPA